MITPAPGLIQVAHRKQLDPVLNVPEYDRAMAQCDKIMIKHFKKLEYKTEIRVEDCRGLLSTYPQVSTSLTLVIMATTARDTILTDQCKWYSNLTLIFVKIFVVTSFKDHERC